MLWCLNLGLAWAYSGNFGVSERTLTDAFESSDFGDLSSANLAMEQRILVMGENMKLIGAEFDVIQTQMNSAMQLASRMQQGDLGAIGEFLTITGQLERKVNLLAQTVREIHATEASSG